MNFYTSSLLLKDVTDKSQVPVEWSITFINYEFSKRSLSVDHEIVFGTKNFLYIPIVLPLDYHFVFCQMSPRLWDRGSLRWGFLPYVLSKTGFSLYLTLKYCLWSQPSNSVKKNILNYLYHNKTYWNLIKWNLYTLKIVLYFVKGVEKYDLFTITILNFYQNKERNGFFLHWFLS